MATNTQPVDSLPVILKAVPGCRHALACESKDQAMGLTSHHKREMGIQHPGSQVPGTGTAGLATMLGKVTYSVLASTLD